MQQTCSVSRVIDYISFSYGHMATPPSSTFTLEKPTALRIRAASYPRSEMAQKGMISLSFGNSDSFFLRAPSGYAADYEDFHVFSMGWFLPVLRRHLRIFLFLPQPGIRNSLQSIRSSRSAAITSSIDPQIQEIMRTPDALIATC